MKIGLVCQSLLAQAALLPDSPQIGGEDIERIGHPTILGTYPKSLQMRSAVIEPIFSDSSGVWSADRGTVSRRKPGMMVNDPPKKRVESVERAATRIKTTARIDTIHPGQEY